MRSGRAIWAAVGFMAASAALIVIVAHQYLLPALHAARGADARERRELAAISLLVLAVVLVVLAGLLVLAFRPGRLVFPRKGQPRQRTRYVDAWTESGRRARTPPDQPQADDRV